MNKFHLNLEKTTSSVLSVILINLRATQRCLYIVLVHHNPVLDLILDCIYGQEVGEIENLFD